MGLGAGSVPVLKRESCGINYLSLPERTKEWFVLAPPNRNPIPTLAHWERNPPTSIRLSRSGLQPPEGHARRSLSQLRSSVDWQV